MKRCCTCKIEKPLTEFSKGQFRCTTCQKQVCAKIRIAQKELVFTHYGQKCKCCGESEQAFLTIDHIKGGGTQHRKKIRGININQWLISNKFPEGFQVLCFNCNWAKHKLGLCPHQKLLTFKNRV